MSATKCLVKFFDIYRIAQKTIRAVLQILRDVDVLNSHKANEDVGQNLKTVSVCLLCAALFRRFFCSDECVDDIVPRLLKALATFDPLKTFVKYDTDMVPQCVDYGRDCSYGYPLVISRSGRNSANHLTYPRWAKFQYYCQLQYNSMFNPSGV